MNTEESVAYIESKLKVITKADQRGQSQLVPFKLWPSQLYYIRNRTNRDICVKNRQQGFSTGVMADNARVLFTQPFERQNIVAHDQDTAEWLFFTVERFHRNLPPAERPKVDWKSGQRMRFPHLDSYIYVDSAQSEHLSLGRTLTRAHLSEMSKWPPRQADALYADVSQTVPEHGFITIEATPKGRNGKFYELYQSAKKREVNYKAFFFAWWWDVTCIRTPQEGMALTSEEKQLIEYVRITDKMELTLQNIAFRREKIAELRDLFFQEYPENDTDCVLPTSLVLLANGTTKTIHSVEAARLLKDKTTEYGIPLDIIPAFAKNDKGQESFPLDENLWEPYINYYDLPGTSYLNMTQAQVDAGILPPEYLAKWQEYQALKTDTAKNLFKEKYPVLAKSTWRDDYRRANPLFDMWLQENKDMKLLAKKTQTTQSIQRAPITLKNPFK